MERKIYYEQPLNERIRILLRLEFLFAQIDQAAAGNSAWEIRTALGGLLDILSLTGRTELRAELLKELERHAGTLQRLQDNPGVDPRMLEGVLDDIAAATERLHAMDSQRLDEVRQNELLNAIRQRSSIPGGTCQFDLPALHHWLHRPPEARLGHLRGWAAPLEPLREAVGLILRLTRQSATASTEVAYNGFYQRALDNGAPNQLVRIVLPYEAEVFPEISGGRHRFSIRFLCQPTPQQRVAPVRDDVAFQLVCCII
ncbi:MAG: cell division protein ZapD [Pseudomonadota bacterium]|nr:cell division protein ZapD [Pseudomonadota bacterium]